MVLILDGYTEIGAHVRSNLCYLTCLRHLIIPKVVRFFFPPKVPIVLYAFADCSELLYICALDFKTVFHASDCSIVIILNGTSESFVLLPA